MAILHERRPCAKGFFRLKKQYRDKHRREDQASSPIRKIASPKLIRGLSITKKDKRGGDTISDSLASSPQRISSPEIRIKNLKQQDVPRKTYGNQFF
jgi:hypothetical protein